MQSARGWGLHFVGPDIRSDMHSMTRGVETLFAGEVKSSART